MEMKFKYFDGREVAFPPSAAEKAMGLMDPQRREATLRGDWGETDILAGILLLALFADDTPTAGHAEGGRVSSIADLAEQAMCKMGFANIQPMAAAIHAIDTNPPHVVLKGIQSNFPSLHLSGSSEAIIKKTRQRVISILRRLEGEGVLTAAIRYGADEGYMTRDTFQYAISALRAMKSVHAIEELIKSLSDSSPIVRGCAFQALQGITGKHFLFSAGSPKKWQKWWYENKKEFGGHDTE